jgi:DNA-binding transcriptional ArsR family regulator
MILWIYGWGMPDPRLDVLTAIHHPVRRRVLEHLHLNGPATVGMLAEGLGLQVGSVSHHLKTLERVGYVEPAPELARDRRESWWRGVSHQVSWSVTDFDDPTDVLLATAAERENLQHHAGKVLGWLGERDGLPTAWVDAGFATEHWATATPDELADLSARVNELFASWAAGCEAAAAGEDDDERARRTPVFVFAHGNPARP